MNTMQYAQKEIMRNLFIAVEIVVAKNIEAKVKLRQKGLKATMLRKVPEELMAVLKWFDADTR